MTLNAFTDLVDLASQTLGGRALACSDDFFASMHNLVLPGPAQFDPDAYTDRGKEMDGWESRRRRTPGHDWCIIELGAPGHVRGLDIDTSHFMGNHPPFASVEGVWAPGATLEQLTSETTWETILPQVGLARGTHNLFATKASGPFHYIRLNIFPDGGVARLRVYGEPLTRSADATDDALVDYAALENGGAAIACSDMFFSPMQNLIAPGRPSTMGGGWETRRRRDPGHDWIIVALGTTAAPEEVEIDTCHFKGNFPPRASVEGIAWPGASPYSLIHSPDWRPLLPPQRLSAHEAHTFGDLVSADPITHVRLNVHPCGGVARLRVRGRARAPQPDAALVRLNEAPGEEASDMLRRACGAERWVRAMVARRPFVSRAHLYGEAGQVWWSLGDADYIEAFGHHPRIGENVEALRKKFASTADLSAAEQAGVASASEQTLQALAARNREYAERFGFIFIVCATGKSAEEMLAILEDRLHNPPRDEIRIAAGEQQKITRLRLENLG